METYTSQADDLHRQANEVECPVYIPPYTNCYEALWANYELVQQAREMENAARDIRIQFQEIASSGLSVPLFDVVEESRRQCQTRKIYVFHRPTCQSGSSVDGEFPLHSLST